MPAFDGILGHAPIVTMLQSLSAKPGQAYLFHGPSGVGKTLVAKSFAAAILSLDNREALHSHPDFATLEREEGGREIKIKQTRELVTRMTMSAARGGYKIALIEEADRLNEESANALLKSVEEPTGDSVYLLISERPSALPATLRSRLASVAFTPLSFADMSGSYPDNIIRESRGCPGIAQRIIDDPDAWHDRRAWAGELLKSLMNDPVGQRLGSIDRLAKRLQSDEDPELAWRAILAELMFLAPDHVKDPAALSEIGRGLARAWHLVGSSLSPQLALEWAVVEPYTTDKSSLPSFLYPTYL